MLNGSKKHSLEYENYGFTESLMYKLFLKSGRTNFSNVAEAEASKSANKK